MSPRDTAGRLCLHLHAHLPFVRHPQHDRFLEEDWFYEAVGECYLPLLEVLERLAEDGVAYELSLSLSPTLLAMLDDELLRRRTEVHLQRTLELAERELLRTRLDGRRNRLLRLYRDRYRRLLRRFCDHHRRDLIGAFGRLEAAGHLAIATSAATHAYLPLLQHRPRLVAAQLQVALAEHQRLLGRAPRGIWLPECGYHAGLDRSLAECGLEYCFLEAHGVLRARPRPALGVFAPIRCPAGPVAFGRDLSSAQLVWSARSGYPGDPEYREFYNDIGHELDLEVVRDHVQPDGRRKDTGIKLHRITGGSGPKGLYRPERAAARAVAHAHHFAGRLRRQAAAAAAISGAGGALLVAPFDAELFGHWWFEGPGFIEALLLELARRPQQLRTVLPDRLAGAGGWPTAEPAASSWGRGGYSQVWLDSSNDWLYNHLDRAATDMLALAQAHPNARGWRRRALDQMARQLLLAQASDWPFILSTGTAVGYALRRVVGHLERVQRLALMVRSGRPDRNGLERLADRDRLFPELDYRIYRRTAAPHR